MTTLRSSCALLAATAVTSMVLTGCSGSDVEAGDVLDARGSFTGTAVDLRVPVGVLTVTVGRPTGSLDGTEAVDGSVEGDGVTFVGIAAELDDGAAGAGLDPQAYLWVAQPLSQPTISVVAGDRSYDLRSDPLSGPGYLAVEGEDVDASDLRLEVTFDGVTQTADVGSGEVDPGDASALYEDPAPLDRGSCADGRFEGVVESADVSCRVTVTELPYVAEAGWAPAGERWTVVETSADVTDARRPGGAVVRTGAVARVDRPEPAAVFDVDARAGSRSDVRVFKAGTDTGTVELRVAVGSSEAVYRAAVTPA